MYMRNPPMRSEVYAAKKYVKKVLKNKIFFTYW